ncbi:MAG: hypothetical protein KDC95_01450 [Planctomycetes bacterium]|nr:hypothetical protein [Planctomycetota bacterium]
MNTKPFQPWLVAALLATPAISQDPSLTIYPAAARPGDSVGYITRARTNAAYAIFVDPVPRHDPFFGQILRIGSPQVVLVASVIATTGTDSGSIRLPNQPALVGASAFLQAFVLDNTSSNGVFRASNGESLSFHASKYSVIERFDDPRASGYQGEFESTKDGRLIGVAPKSRTVLTVDSTRGYAFGQPVVGELSPYGAHQQVVLRPVDLASQGDEEIVTAIRMRPFGSFGTGVVGRLAIDMSHSGVSPDFTVDAFSALPKYPASGLQVTYSKNVKAGATPQRVFNGPWAIDPKNLTKDGFLAYPTPSGVFRYNGADSLLIDFRVAPVSTLPAGFGHTIRLAIQSSARPNARIFRQGTSALPYDPFNAPLALAQDGDNSLFVLQVDLVDATSVVVSPWRSSGRQVPIYRKPVLAASLPPGTSISVELREALDSQGTGASAFTEDVTQLRGLPYFQERITLRGLPDGTRPWLEALVVPID